MLSSTVWLLVAELLSAHDSVGGQAVLSGNGVLSFCGFQCPFVNMRECEASCGLPWRSEAQDISESVT